MDKRGVLSIEGRVKVIRQIEKGKKKAEFSREIGLLNSVIQTICKKENQNFYCV